MKPFEHKCANPACENKVINYDPRRTQPCSKRCELDIKYGKKFIDKK